MTANKHRPSFRFSLRTLFAVVTLACVSLAWYDHEANIVRNRQAMRMQIRLAGGRLEHRSGSILFDSVAPLDASRKVSLLQRWLGDEHQRVIVFERQLTDADWDVVRAFPEAKVCFPMSWIQIGDHSVRHVPRRGGR